MNSGSGLAEGERAGIYPPSDSGGFEHQPGTVPSRALSLIPSLARLVLARIGWVFASGDSRDAEILALRHQILVLQRRIGRAKFNETDRTILALLGKAIDGTRRGLTFLIVRTETMLQWHRRLVARHWTQPPAKKRGRPPIDPQIRRLIIRLAKWNPDWGYRRVHGELTRLGHKFAASTVWKVLRTAGIDPTRDRTGPTWSVFIRSQSKAILAGTTANPTGLWTTQAARNLMMKFGEHHPFKYLIRDGARQFTRSFDTVLAGSGIMTVRIPPGSPQANAFVERWVRTLRHELLDRTIIWNEQQLRVLLEEYVEHYNSHRPHCGIQQRAPNDHGDVIPIGKDQPIKRHTTCAGLINEYRTAAWPISLVNRSQRNRQLQRAPEHFSLCGSRSEISSITPDDFSIPSGVSRARAL